MRVQLWSYNYSPEPTGIAPVSAVLAEGLSALGHDVSVVAAHPHYPEPVWGVRRRPYRERRNGIPVLRLPLWAGRESTSARMRQELSFLVSQTVATPFLGRPDVFISVSPSFPALLPASLRAHGMTIPWALWLQDVLPDGALATGLIDPGPALRAARHLERFAYRSADRIVAVSRSFVCNLVAKSVPEDKIRLVYNPATQVPNTGAPSRQDDGTLRLLCMGNIGRSQGLVPFVRAFEAAAWPPMPDVRLTLTGTGVAAEDVRSEIRTERVSFLGVVSSEELRGHLKGANIGLVTQQYEGPEFNLPSKVMNYMAWGLPVLVVADPQSEVARLIEQSGGGWIADSSRPERVPELVREIAEHSAERQRRARAARAFAEGHFTAHGFSARFDEVISEIALRSAPRSAD